MLVNDLRLYFEFEVEVRACLPNTGGSVTSAYESQYYMTQSHVNSSSKDDLVYADRYQVNVSRQLRKNLRKLEELNYCKVNDADAEFNDWDFTLTLDVDINEHELGAYGENGAIFFARKAIPHLVKYPKYDSMKVDRIVMPYLACIRIYSVDK